MLVPQPRDRKFRVGGEGKESNLPTPVERRTPGLEFWRLRNLTGTSSEQFQVISFSFLASITAWRQRNGSGLRPPLTGVRPGAYTRPGGPPMRILGAIAFVLWTLSPAAAVDITACNQGVPAGQVGVLQNDLDCSGQPSSTDGVWIERGGTLDLNGRTIVGAPFAIQPNGGIRAAVHCRLGRRCEGSPIVCRPGRGRCTVTSSTGTGHVISNTGINSERHLDVSHVQVSGGGYVVAGDGKLRAVDLQVSGGGTVAGDKALLTDVSVVGANSFGIFMTKRIRGTNVTVTGCGNAGLSSANGRLTGLVATGNGVSPSSHINGGGVHGGRWRLTDSTVTGNQANFANPPASYPVDVLTVKRPVLVGTTCDHSAMLTGSVPYVSWGVCSSD